MQLPRKMSAHNVMASISRTLGTQKETRALNEPRFAKEETEEKMKDDRKKENQKLMRVLTVIAYMISVSLAAIVLSLYYTYIWDPKDHPHYIAKQRLNVTTRTPCPEVVTQTALGELTPSLVQQPSPVSETPVDLATPVSSTTTEFMQRASVETRSHQTVKGLLETLTTPISQRDPDYSSSTDLPGLASISSDQFRADNYHDATIVPAVADEFLDD